MSAHDFENKVQQQMEELNLSPSDAIWNNVELQLKKDKKRRRVIIWLPLLLLISLGGYLIAVNNSTNKSISAESSEQVNNTNNNSTNEVKSIENTEVKKTGVTSIEPTEKGKNNDLKTGDVVVENEKVNSVEKKSQISSGVSREKLAFSNENVIKSKKNRIYKAASSNETVSSKQIKDVIKNQKESSSASTSIANNDNSKTEVIDESEPSYKTAMVRNQSLNYEKAAVPVSLSMDSHNKTELVPTSVSPVVTVKSDKNKKQSKWQWGATVGFGVSRVSEGNFFSGLSGASVADASYSASTNLPPVPTFTPQPAAIHAGPSWQAGFFLQRKLTDKISLSAGLQYGNYSTRSSIGMVVDSQKTISNSSSQDLRVSNFYTTGSSTNYQNRYQYFEIPVNAHIRLNKSRQLPFYWTIGATYSTLLRTTALHYDGSSGVYYEDDKLFRKSQFSWQTGLSIELLSQSKHPIQIGPQLHYNATSLLSGTASQNTHLWGGSLQLRWFF